MQLDEWTEDELALMRAVGGGAESPFGRVGPDKAAASFGGARPSGGADDGAGIRSQEILHALKGIDDLDAGPLLDVGLDERTWLDEPDEPRGSGAERTPCVEAAVEASTTESDDGGCAAGDVPGDADAVEVRAGHALMGGDGVIVEVRIGGRPARAWVDERSWCEWLSARLPVRAVSQVPEGLAGVLGQWALSALAAQVEVAGVALPDFVSARPGSCAPADAAVLRIRRAGQELSLRLLDWPPDWLAAVAGGLEDWRTPLTMPPMRACLAAGWVRLTLSSLRKLRAGDGLVIDRPAWVEHGRVWLVAQTPVAELAFEDNTWRVEQACRQEDDMSEFDLTVASSAALGDEHIHLTAVVEVGRMSLSLDCLRNLRSGQVLDLPHSADGKVSLMVSGHVMATGSLMRVGDRLVMRIE